MLALFFTRLPSSFLPSEDQGDMLVNVQLPPGATVNRTRSVMQQVEGFMLQQPEVQSMVSVLGFSFSGSGQNAGLAFVTLKDWDEREGAGHSAQAVSGRAFGALSGVRDAFIFPLSPPPIPELGSASGFSFRLQDRGEFGAAVCRTVFQTRSTRQDAVRPPFERRQSQRRQIAEVATTERRRGDRRRDLTSALRSLSA